jgi:hypothetical protein
MQAHRDLELTCINTIRTLAMDAVQVANSGHAGTPMALAPVAYCPSRQGHAGNHRLALGPRGENRRPGSQRHRGGQRLIAPKF